MREQTTRSNENLIAKVVSVLRARHRMWMPSQKRITYHDVVFRGDLATREFIAFWLKDGRLVAGMNVNVWDVAETIGALVAGQRTVAAARLTDPMSSLTAWSNDTGRRSTLGVLCQPWS